MLAVAAVLPFCACLADAVLTAEVVGSSALYAAQCMLLFGFAAAALELGFSNGWVKRMGGTVSS